MAPRLMSGFVHVPGTVRELGCPSAQPFLSKAASPWAWVCAPCRTTQCRGEEASLAEAGWMLSCSLSVCPSFLPHLGPWLPSPDLFARHSGSPPALGDRLSRALPR